MNDYSPVFGARIPFFQIPVAVQNRGVQSMSALPPKVDMVRHDRDVRVEHAALIASPPHGGRSSHHGSTKGYHSSHQDGRCGLVAATLGKPPR